MEIRELIEKLEDKKNLYIELGKQGMKEAKEELPKIYSTLASLYAEEARYMREDLEEIIRVALK